MARPASTYRCNRARPRPGAARREALRTQRKVEVERLARKLIVDDNSNRRVEQAVENLSHKLTVTDAAKEAARRERKNAAARARRAAAKRTEQAA